ncbi:hypothetical protein GCM10009801_72900 [Streptomyces albiaxialis]|uniref:Uncharacterized protein n=1 Tax=Streptomyces albiaxialis TaxID=329523 RepID=A0ABN2WWN4_9ACTN
MPLDRPALVPVPPGALVVLIGPAGSGKSTTAASLAAPEAVAGRDEMRHRIAGDPNDQGATAEAGIAQHLILRGRLRRQLAAVADSTNLDPAARAALLDLARPFTPHLLAVLHRVPVTTCLRRAATRERQVPPEVIREQALRARPLTLPGLRAEGWSAAYLAGPPGALLQPA